MQEKANKQNKQMKTKQKITRCLLIAETVSATPLCSLAVVTTVLSGSPNFGTFLIRQGLRCGYEFSPILPKSLGPYSILLVHPFLGSCPQSQFPLARIEDLDIKDSLTTLQWLLMYSRIYLKPFA